MLQNICRQIEQEERELSLSGDGKDIDSLASSTSIYTKIPSTFTTFTQNAPVTLPKKDQAVDLQKQTSQSQKLREIGVKRRCKD